MLLESVIVALSGSAASYLCFKVSLPPNTHIQGVPLNSTWGCFGLFTSLTCTWDLSSGTLTGVTQAVAEAFSSTAGGLIPASWAATITYIQHRVTCHSLVRHAQSGVSAPPLGGKNLSCLLVTTGYLFSLVFPSLYPVHMS